MKDSLAEITCGREAQLRRGVAVREWIIKNVYVTAQLLLFA